MTTAETHEQLRKKYKKNPLSKSQKFKEIMVLCKAMADYACTLGTKEFNEKNGFLMHGLVAK
jgi:hypothetical protein